jgi:hypothetical protein
MAIILFFISILLVFLILLSYEEIDISKSIIGTLLISSLLVTVSSEVLSLFHSFNYASLASFWSLTMIIGSIIVLKCKANSNQIKEKATSFISSIKNNKLLFSIISLILILIGFQGFIYPPNNWDSLTYHMARIPHWIINENISPFPTAISRQVNSPPFSELFISQLNILAKNDYFSNFIQYIFLIGNIAVSILISNNLNFSKKAKIICCFLILTTPEFLLQASSTQNDIVVSFFILSSCLFTLISYQCNSNKDYILLAISVGLGFFTKGTAYIYLLPILCLWCLLILLKYRTKKTFYKLAFIPIISILINIGFYTRNYSYTEDPLGKNEDKLFNEEISLKKITLTSLKNIGIHFAIYPLNQITNKIVEKSHLLLNEKIDNPKTNFNGTKFHLKKWQHHEDDASNILQILIFFICIILFLFNLNKFASFVWILLLIPLAEFLIFSVVLKWQPWHTRLETPIFFLILYFIAIVIDRTVFNSKIIVLTSLILTFYSFIIVLYNPTRPYITNQNTTEIRITDSRFKKYFANNMILEKDYLFARKLLKNYENKVATDLWIDSWEYPFYFDVYSTNQSLAVPINLNNSTKNIKNIKNKNFNYIISTNHTDSTFVWNKINFHRVQKLRSFTIYKIN